MSRPTLALVGLRGSGKSTVGSLLARELGCSFVDLDDALLAEANAARADAPWESAGELLLGLGAEAFRDVEARALERLLASDARKVLATGGGAVERAANRSALRQRAWVAWLQVDVPSLQERLRAGTALRPALIGPDPVSEVPALARLREPLYRAVAHSVIACGADSPPVLRDRILRAWPGFAGQAAAPRTGP